PAVVYDRSDVDTPLAEDPSRLRGVLHRKDRERRCGFARRKGFTVLQLPERQARRSTEREHREPLCGVEVRFLEAKSRAIPVARCFAVRDTNEYGSQP